MSREQKISLFKQGNILSPRVDLEVTIERPATQFDMVNNVEAISYRAFSAMGDL